jgi:hypothetical protein
MAAETPVYDLPYPLPTDEVDVAGDIQALADRLDLVLQTIGTQENQEVRNLSGVTINAGDPVYISGFNTKPTIAKSDSDNILTFPVAGLAVSEITNNTDGQILAFGILKNVDTASFAVGDVLYVASGGGLTNTQPSGGSGAIGIVFSSNASTGSILFGSPKGNGTWGSLKAGLA